MKRLAIFFILFALLCTNAFSQGKQFLYIEITPYDATLEINGEVMHTDQGVYQELVSLGKYTYKVYKEGYSATTGTIDVSDPRKACTLEIKLKEQRGYLSIESSSMKDNLWAHNSNSDEAKVYIDDIHVGNLPMKYQPVASGTHKITIKHPLFKEYCETIVISDGENKIIFPEMQQTHAHIVVSGEEIYIDNEYKGKYIWEGYLELGKTYVMESKKTGHSSSPIEYTLVYHGTNVGSIDLPDPTPVYGSLEITSGPVSATVFIDGKEIGRTPQSIEQIIVGEHEVYIRTNDYTSAVKKVNVSKGTLSSLYFETPCGSLSVTSTPSNAKLYIDDEYVGVTPMYIPDISAGYHNIKVEESSKTYQPYIISEKIYIRENEHNATSYVMPHGSLSITSTPPNAKIFIDHNFVGVTPKDIPAIIAGNHTVTVAYSIGDSSTKAVNIAENEHLTVIFDRNINEAELYSDQIDIVEDDIEEDDIEVEYIIIDLEDDEDFKITLMDYQEEVVEEVVEEEAIPFQLVEEKPSFKGGDANTFSKWVNQRLVYPEIAKENGVQGRVTLQFTVEKDGRITNVKVLRGVDPSLDKEAIRVVSSSPKWIPGKQRNRAVPVTYTFPVIFQLR